MWQLAHSPWRFLINHLVTALRCSFSSGVFKSAVTLGATSTTICPDDDDEQSSKPSGQNGLTRSPSTNAIETIVTHS